MEQKQFTDLQDDGSYRIGLWSREGKASDWEGKIEIKGEKFFVDIYPNKKKEPGDKRPSHNLVLKPMYREEDGVVSGNYGTAVAKAHQKSGFKPNTPNFALDDDEVPF